MTTFNDGDICLDEETNVYIIVEGKPVKHISGALIMVNEDEYISRYKHFYGRDPNKLYSKISTLADTKMMKAFKALVNYYWDYPERIRQQ